jgi:hypothetical protein
MLPTAAKTNQRPREIVDILPQMFFMVLVTSLVLFIAIRRAHHHPPQPYPVLIFQEELITEACGAQLKSLKQVAPDRLLRPRPVVTAPMHQRHFIRYYRTYPLPYE